MRRDHAIVIGASIGGLLSARVLSEVYSKVTILERDSLPDGVQFRAGVPQGRQLHLLLMRGLLELEKLFPNLRDDMKALGGNELDLMNDCRYLFAAGWAEPQPSNYRSIIATRPLFDAAILGRIRQIANIEIQTRHDVTDLLFHGRQVVGVQVRNRDTGEQREVAANLVVDAAGRPSKLPEWLEHHQFGRVKETIYKSDVGYATRMYTAPADWQGWPALFVMPMPPHIRHGATFLKVENDQWLLTIGGVGSQRPPTDNAEFEAWLARMRTPLVAEITQKFTPASQVYGYAKTENRWVHYEQLPVMPAGLIAIADSVCALNPIYGQGITNTTLSAQLLATWLQREGVGSAPWALGFQKALARRNKSGWITTISEDSRLADTPTYKPILPIRVLQWYSDKVNMAAAGNRAATNAMVGAIHMIGSAASLFAPKVFLAAAKFFRKQPPSSVPAAPNK
ncbi:NAD(P)/FAD-dependent oxidoreductase [Herpetosiphon sp. NSE202]|uniref:NAD(P)/FAD-dependent oxidoreductase n=1 Tax=Herpetosiphon sp. NSE202 TaxID=3351349 RepID=UPI003645BAC9